MEENKKPLAEGEEKEEAVSKNFIEREIDKDLAEGVYDHVQTRFLVRHGISEENIDVAWISSYWTR